MLFYWKIIIIIKKTSSGVSILHFPFRQNQLNGWVGSPACCQTGMFSSLSQTTASTSTLEPVTSTSGTVQKVYNIPSKNSNPKQEADLTGLLLDTTKFPKCLRWELQNKMGFYEIDIVIYKRTYCECFFIYLPCIQLPCLYLSIASKCLMTVS